MSSVFSLFYGGFSFHGYWRTEFDFKLLEITSQRSASQTWRVFVSPGFTNWMSGMFHFLGKAESPRWPSSERRGLSHLCEDVFLSQENTWNQINCGLSCFFSINGTRIARNCNRDLCPQRVIARPFKWERFPANVSKGSKLSDMLHETCRTNAVNKNCLLVRVTCYSAVLGRLLHAVTSYLLVWLDLFLSWAKLKVKECAVLNFDSTHVRYRILWSTVASRMTSRDVKEKRIRIWVSFSNLYLLQWWPERAPKIGSETCGRSSCQAFHWRL